MRIAIIDDGRSCARKASNYISQVSWDPRGRKAFSNEWFLLERLMGRYVQLLLITVDAFVALCRQVTCLIPTLPRLPVIPATISPDRYSMSDFERRSQQIPRAHLFSQECRTVNSPCSTRATQPRKIAVSVRCDGWGATERVLSLQSL